MFDKYIAALESFDAECQEAYSDYVISRFVGMEAEDGKPGAGARIKEFGSNAWKRVIGVLTNILNMIRKIPTAIREGLGKLAGIFKKAPKEVDSDAEIEQAVEQLDQSEKKMNVFASLIQKLRSRLAKVKSGKVDESDVAATDQDVKDVTAEAAAESYANNADWLFALEADEGAAPKGKKFNPAAIFARIKSLLTKSEKLSKDAENGQKEAVDAATAASKDGNADPKKQNILMRALSAIGRGFAAVGSWIKKHVLDPITALAGRIRAKITKKSVENYDGPDPAPESSED